MYKYESGWWSVQTPHKRGDKAAFLSFRQKRLTLVGKTSGKSWQKSASHVRIDLAYSAPTPLAKKGSTPLVEWIKSGKWKRHKERDNERKRLRKREKDRERPNSKISTRRMWEHSTKSREKNWNIIITVLLFIIFAKDERKRRCVCYKEPHTNKV